MPHEEKPKMDLLSYIFGKGCSNPDKPIYYSILLLAIIGAGGYFTGSNPSYTSYELNHHIRVSRAKFLVVEPPMLAITLQSASDCKVPLSRVFTFETKGKDSVPGQRSWTSLLEHGESDWITFDEANLAKSTVAILSFTSGTTGFPKAAMVSHSYAINQLHILKHQDPPYEVSRLIGIPAFHAFAIPLMTGCAIREQQTAYIMRRFDLKTFLESIDRFRITEIPMVPTMLIAVLMSELTNRDKLQSLRSIWVGGSPLRSSTQKDFQALLHPDARVTQVWGMTETGWTTILFHPETDETGSVGRLAPGMSSKLVAEDGSIITEDNKQGELFIKGASLMNGYYHDPVATAATIDEEGWLRTGDIAYCIQGKWYIIDRKKDIIKVHGWQVAPAELEAILLTHPEVINVAVVGIPLEDGTGEVPHAFVVLKAKPLDGTYASQGEFEEHSTTEDELKTYLGSRLAKYKALNGVTFVDDIPRTPSGKLQKFKLREMYTDLLKKRKRKSDVLGVISEENGATQNGNTLKGASKPLGVERSDDASTLNGGVKSNGIKSNGMTRASGGDKSENATELSNGEDTAKGHGNGYNTRKRVKT
ncbi:MAG: hypothetical protein Q9174_002751 [Haloplaca sp. 1 TL-2023]